MVLLHLGLHGLDEFGHHALARCLRSQHGAAAEVITALEDDRVIAALFEQERRLHAAGAAAHDCDRAVIAGLDKILVAIDRGAAGNGVDGAVQVLARNDGLVAVHAAKALADKILAAGHRLFDHVGISQLHAGHADKVAHALLQEALGRLGVLDGVDGDNGHIHGSLDGLGQVLSPALGAVARLDHGRCAGVNAAGDVEVIHIRLEVLGDLRASGEVIAALDKIVAVDARADNEVTADSGADTGEDAHEEAAAVFHASAVFIGALVGVGAQKLLHKVAVRRVDLHAVGAGKLGVDRRLNIFLDQIVNVLNGHLARQDGRAADDGVELNARGHGLTAAVAGRGGLAAAVVQLDEDLRAVTVHRLADELEALDLPAVIDAELDGVAVAAVGIDGGELRDDEAAAAFGTVLVETDLLRRGAAVPVAHEGAHGCHNDTVTQLQVADLAGLKQFFVLHEAFLLFHWIIPKPRVSLVQERHGMRILPPHPCLCKYFNQPFREFPYARNTKKSVILCGTDNPGHPVEKRGRGQIFAIVRRAQRAAAILSRGTTAAVAPRCGYVV